MFILHLTLVSLHPRINLSPFTKDFRGEEQYNESIDEFLNTLLRKGHILKIKLSLRIHFLKMVRNFQYINFNEHFELVLSVHL